MVVRIGIVKLVLGIAGMIVIVQILAMLHFSSLQSNDVNLKFRKSVLEPDHFNDILGQKFIEADKPVAVYEADTRDKFQVINSSFILLFPEVSLLKVDCHSLGKLA